MITSIRIAWLAGLIEGEGCLDMSNGYPRIRIQMADKDVIMRVCKLFDCTCVQVEIPTYKMGYVAVVTGRKAVSWMLMAFTFLGVRRREDIKSILTKWRSTPSLRGTTDVCKRGHRKYGRHCRICDVEQQRLRRLKSRVA